MDLNTTAFHIVRNLTEKKEDSNRTIAARTAGKVGGAARAKRLTAAQRHDIAVAANKALREKRQASRIQ